MITAVIRIKHREILDYTIVPTWMKNGFPNKLSSSDPAGQMMSHNEFFVHVASLLNMLNS